MAEFNIPSFLQNCSTEEIHDMMMQQLPENIDKSEGGHPWNLTMPTAYAVAYFVEFVLTEAVKSIFPRFSEGSAEIMDYHAEARGLSRKEATAATGELTVTGDAGTTIPAGTRVSTMIVNGENNIVFVTIEDATIGPTGTATVEIEAEEAGLNGNVQAGTITYIIDQIDGVDECTNPTGTQYGTDEESTESLQQRIMEYDESNSISFVGSVSDYKRWALEVNGTGDAHVIPAQDESGTVTIVVTNSNGQPADENLLEAVYDHIMKPDNPLERLAPINAVLSVIAPTIIALNVEATVEHADETMIEDITAAFREALKTYMLQAIKEGEVKYTKVCSVLSGIDGVDDFAALKINNGTANISLQDMSIPEVGTITLTEGTV